MLDIDDSKSPFTDKRSEIFVDDVFDKSASEFGTNTIERDIPAADSDAHRLAKDYASKWAGQTCDKQIENYSN